MDLLDILKKQVDPNEIMPIERKRALAVALNNLNRIQATNAWKIITGYKNKFDSVRRVGEKSSTYPYYSQPHENGDITMTIMRGEDALVPEELLLMLELLVKQAD